LCEKNSVSLGAWNGGGPSTEGGRMPWNNWHYG